MKLHPNIAIVRRFYHAFISRDLTTIWSIAGDDLAFHVPGRSKWAGAHRGREQILELFTRLGSETERSVRMTIHDIVGGDEHVVGLHHVTAAPGRAFARPQRHGDLPRAEREDHRDLAELAVAAGVRRVLGVAMPISEEDVDAIRKLYVALRDRDIPALAKAFATASYHVPGNSIVSGTYRGSEEILGLFQRTYELTDGTLTFELHDLVGGEEHVCMLDRARATRNGRTLDQSRVVIIHVAGGVTTDVWLVVADEYDFDEFWS